MNKTLYLLLVALAFGKNALMEFLPGKRVFVRGILISALVMGYGGFAQADPVLGPNPPVPPAYSSSIFTVGDGIVPADLFHPFGLAVDRLGNLYVTDRLNDRVLMRDTSNTWSVLSNGSGTALGRFTHVGVTGGPAGIAVDLAGNVYVADWGNHRVQKCDTNGNWTAWGAQPWGTPGAGLGQFNNPSGIAVDSAGNVYVADTTNNRIQMRDTSGTWTEWYNAWNWVPGGFNGPKGVAVDSAGNVYVADQSNQRIHLRTADGTWSFISSTVSGTAPGYFNNPTQITVDSAGNA
jgi:tripartite motif-containing protein 71